MLIGYWLLGKFLFRQELILGLSLFVVGLILICILGLYSIFDAYKVASWEVILNIKVIPKAKRSYIQKEENGFKVYLTNPAQDGLANKQLIELLSEYLKIKKYQIKIIKGEKSRNKLVKIDAWIASG